MKKNIWILSFLILTVPSVCFSASRTLNGIPENEQLGMMAGLALACNAGGLLDDYELIASRIMANPAVTKQEELSLFRGYAQAKLKAYKEQKNAPEVSCGEVLDRFSRLPIFQSVVYADGTVKLPDGKVITPKRKTKMIPAKKPASKKYSKAVKRSKKSHSRQTDTVKNVSDVNRKNEVVSLKR